MSEPCRLGYVEYDGARYCFEHGDFLEAGVQSLHCGRGRDAIARESFGTCTKCGERMSMSDWPDHRQTHESPRLP